MFCPRRLRKFILVKLSTFTVLSVSENIGLPAWNVNKIHLLVTHLLSYVNGDNRYLTNDAILITIFEQVEPGKAGKQKISGKWLENTPKICDFCLDFFPLTSGNLVQRADLSKM